MLPCLRISRSVLLCAALTLPAFAILIPPDLIVAIGGFFLWQGRSGRTRAPDSTRGGPWHNPGARLHPARNRRVQALGIPDHSKDAWTVTAYFGALALAG